MIPVQPKRGILFRTGKELRERIDSIYDRVPPAGAVGYDGAEGGRNAGAGDADDDEGGVVAAAGLGGDDL